MVLKNYKLSPPHMRVEVRRQDSLVFHRLPSRGQNDVLHHWALVQRSTQRRRESSEQKLKHKTLCRLGYLHPRITASSVNYNVDVDVDVDVDVVGPELQVRGSWGEQCSEDAVKTRGVGQSRVLCITAEVFGGLFGFTWHDAVLDINIFMYRCVEFTLRWYEVSLRTYSDPG